MFIIHLNISEFLNVYYNLETKNNIICVLYVWFYLCIYVQFNLYTFNKNLLSQDSLYVHMMLLLGGRWAPTSTCEVTSAQFGWKCPPFL